MEKLWRKYYNIKEEIESPSNVPEIIEQLENVKNIIARNTDRLDITDEELEKLIEPVKNGERRRLKNEIIDRQQYYKNNKPRVLVAPKWKGLQDAFKNFDRWSKNKEIKQIWKDLETDKSENNSTSVDSSIATVNLRADTVPIEIIDPENGVPIKVIDNNKNNEKKPEEKQNGTLINEFTYKPRQPNKITYENIVENDDEEIEQNKLELYNNDKSQAVEEQLLQEKLNEGKRQFQLSLMRNNAYFGPKEVGLIDLSQIFSKMQTATHKVATEELVAQYYQNVSFYGGAWKQLYRGVELEVTLEKALQLILNRKKTVEQVFQLINSKELQISKKEWKNAVEAKINYLSKHKMISREYDNYLMEKLKDERALIEALIHEETEELLAQYQQQLDKNLEQEKQERAMSQLQYQDTRTNEEILNDIQQDNANTTKEKRKKRKHR